MNRIRKICVLMGLMAPLVAFSDGQDWLWERSAKALPLDTNSGKTVIVCTPNDGCQMMYIIENDE